MKYISHEWEKKYDGILYFIQRLEEMLFHYSDDIVKAPMHNTATLIREYIKLDKDKSVHEYHKKLVAEELDESIQNDEIIKSEFGRNFVAITQKSLQQKQRETVYYLDSIINLGKYYNWTTKYLLNNIMKENQKNEINSCLRKWIASVIYIGYSAPYIYRYLHSQFEQCIENPIDEIEKFLNHFDYNKTKYRVYINFMGGLKSYCDLIKNRLSVRFDADECFAKIFNKNKVGFIGYLDIEAIDPYSAAEEAYSNINIFISFYRVLSNRRKSLIGKTVYIRNVGTGEELYIPIREEGYKAIEVEPKIQLHKIIDYAILGCQKKREYSQLRTMIELHNKALKQTDYDDAFVNLWSIMEVVSSDADDDSKIGKVIHSVLPILQNDYFEEYFRAIWDDLRKSLTEEDCKELVGGITEKGNMPCKIACFTLLDKYEKERDWLFSKLSGYPNLRQKMYRMYALRNNKKGVFKISEDYARRLRWHIYRLYRMRNKIVHSGEQDKNVRVLGEHLHIYCDGIILELIVKLSENDSFQTIRDVLVDTRLLVESKKDLFYQKGSVQETDIYNMFAHYLRDLNY